MRLQTGASHQMSNTAEVTMTQLALALHTPLRSKLEVS